MSEDEMVGRKFEEAREGLSKKYQELIREMEEKISKVVARTLEKFESFK